MYYIVMVVTCIILYFSGFDLGRMNMEKIILFLIGVALCFISLFIGVCVFVCVYIFIHPVMDTSVVSVSWLL